MLWYRCTLNRKKNVNSRHLYLCVLRCVADRVIWDFLLSLTVTTINHIICFFFLLAYTIMFLILLRMLLQTFFIFMFLEVNLLFLFFILHAVHLKSTYWLIWQTQTWGCWCCWCSFARQALSFVTSLRAAMLPMNLMRNVDWHAAFIRLFGSSSNLLSHL